MNNIETFLKDSLDNKLAYVTSSGLNVCGGLEQKCKLDFMKNRGIICSTQIEYNNSTIIDDIRALLNKSDLITYEAHDKLIADIMPKLKGSYVQIGYISYYGIKSMECKWNDKGEVTEILITYKNGSITEIRCIQNISNK